MKFILLKNMRWNLKKQLHFCRVHVTNIEYILREGGLEPPQVTPPDPKSGASTSSAILARILFSNKPYNKELRQENN
jgi:hypothetical protein